METKITGTKEWAEKNINLFTGKCVNGCIYCYASANITRYNQNPDFIIKEELLDRNFKRRNYLTMYPSVHDIRPENIKQHIQFLTRFLESGSEILIVTKPHFSCVADLCFNLRSFKRQIEFRFTVGSSDSEVLNFYEPNAPDFNERVKSLVTAYFADYKTSISIEPMLDEHPEHVIERVHAFTTGEIWIGKMNHPKARLKLNGHLDKMDRVNQLIEWQSNDENILRIVKKLSVFPNVRWKDSIKEVIERNTL